MITAEVKSKVNEDISLLISIDNHPYQYICDCGEASGFSVKEYQNTKAIFISHTLYQEDNFTVRYTILDHKTDSIAYRFDHADKVNIDLESSELRGGSWIEGLKEAFLNHKPDLVLNIQGQEYLAKNLFPLLNITKGHSLGVIMDHAANAINHQKIEQLFSNCNTVYIERFFKKSDQELAKAHYHSYTLASASIMKKIGVQKAIPIHFSRRYKTEDIQDLILEFEEIFED